MKKKCSNKRKHRCSVWWPIVSVLDPIVPLFELYFCPLSISGIWGKLLKASKPQFPSF